MKKTSNGSPSLTAKRLDNSSNRYSTVQYSTVQYSTFKPVSHNGNSKNFLTFIFVMVITVTSFLGSSRAFAQDDAPPPCMKDECPEAQWTYERARLQPGVSNKINNIGTACEVLVDYKRASGCGKCFISILSYKYDSTCLNSNVTHAQLMSVVLASLISGLSDKMCRSTPQEPCVNEIRVSIGSCVKIYHYSDVKDHDPNGNDTAYVTVPNSYVVASSTGTNLSPRRIPILPGQVVYIPCSPVCCKANYEMCWEYDNNGNAKYLGLRRLSVDMGFEPPCTADYDPNDGIPCKPNCWLDEWNFDVIKIPKPYQE